MVVQVVLGCAQMWIFKPYILRRIEDLYNAPIKNNEGVVLGPYQLNAFLKGTLLGLYKGEKMTKI